MIRQSKQSCQLITLGEVTEV